MDLPGINLDCPACRVLLTIIRRQQKQINCLEQRLEKVEREGKRQAAPFRKKRKADPQKPGRKSGQDHGGHHRRAVPETYDVPLPACCPDAATTNWRGEQAIRPAVVNRKVWGGNRTDAGALARSRIMSEMQTCQQRLADPFEFIRRQLTSTEPLPLPITTQ